MTVDYRIEPDYPRCALRLTLIGHWSVETVAAYRRDLDRAYRAMTAAGCMGGALLLIDLRDHDIQSRAVAEALQAIGERLQARHRRMAILCADSLLQKFQALRIAPNRDREVFLAEPEAQAWLLEREALVAGG